MEPEEEIYVNLEELSVTAGRKEEAGSNPVWASSVAEEERETWSQFKVATVCLGLLCFVLLTSVVGIAVIYDRDFIQLSKDLANHTAERNQLLSRNQNLTDERNQLETSLRRAELELTRTMNDSAMCPHGWRKFGCSCYLLLMTKSTWDNSRQVCGNHGAELVIINSQEEMVFLNKLGANSKLWIGLSKTSSTSEWKWTDGSSPTLTYWQHGQPSWNNIMTQRCAAFNSFSTWTYYYSQSWSSELCTSYLQFVCEKQAVPSGTTY